MRKYSYYRPTQNSVPFSYASLNLYSKPAATEGSEASSETETKAASSYAGAWGTNTSTVGANGEKEAANTQAGTDDSAAGEEVVYEPVLIRPVKAKHVVDGELVNAPSLEGWSPDMKKIGEATAAERQLVSA